MVLIGPYQYPCERMQSFYFINDFSMGMTVAHIFNVKTLQKMGIEGHYLNIVKSISMGLQRVRHD